jgi:hypothetical protein
MLGKFWVLATTNGVPLRSLIVAIVIGSLLTLINQYDALFANIAFNWYKAALTYLVPYVVATYGSVMAKW